MSSPPRSRHSSPEDEEYEAIKASDFKQQRLKAWRPVPTICVSVVIFEIFGTIFLAIGILILIFSFKVAEVTFDYSFLPLGKKSLISVPITEDLDAPVFVYYVLEGSFQNHRRYLKSRSSEQLHGESLSLSSLKSSADCDPVYTNKDMGKSVNLVGDKLDPEAPAVPCGLMAKNYFTDRFEGFRVGENKIKVEEKGIAWESDLKIVFRNTRDISSQWLSLTDEHFVVWMRPSPFGAVKKKWGKVERDLKEGEVVSLWVDNSYDVSIFNGKKKIFFVSPSAVGGKHKFLGVSYICVGLLGIFTSLGFSIGGYVGGKKF